MVRIVPIHFPKKKTLFPIGCRLRSDSIRIGITESLLLFLRQLDHSPVSTRCSEAGEDLPSNPKHHCRLDPARAGCPQHGHAAVPRLVLDQSAHLSGLLRLGNMAGTRRTAEETPASQPDLMSRAACTLDVCTRQSKLRSTHFWGQFAFRPDFMTDYSLRNC